MERKLEKIEKIPRKKEKNGKGRIVSDKVGKTQKKVRKNTGGSYEVRCTKKERKTEGKTERNKEEWSSERINEWMIKEDMRNNLWVLVKEKTQRMNCRRAEKRKV